MAERVSRNPAELLNDALVRVSSLRGLSACREGIVAEVLTILGGGEARLLRPGAAARDSGETPAGPSSTRGPACSWPLDPSELASLIGAERLPEGPGPWLLLVLGGGDQASGLLVARPAREPTRQELEALEMLAPCAGLALQHALLERRFDARGNRLAGIQERLEGAERSSLAAHHLRTAARLLPGFAHELNNPLTALGGYAGMLAALPAEGLEQNREYLARIQEQAMRCTLLVGRLMAFLRWERAEGQVVGLQAAVEEALELAAHPLRKASAQVDLQLDANPLLRGVPAGHLVQVILDLIANALVAMTAGEERRLVLRSEAGKGCVHLRIEDSGDGVPREARGRIFEKFFTTRDADGATGLGLPSCIELLEEVGGCISLETSDGAGTRVTVTLPVRDS